MGVFSGPKTPDPPADPILPPPPDAEESRSLVAARARRRIRSRLAAGRSSTVLTSSQGLPSVRNSNLSSLLGE